MIQVFSINQNSSLIQREETLKLASSWEKYPGVLLKTCNRIEFYEGVGLANEDVINHLFRVVSGLESNLIGEIAIQGQVKNAYIEASRKFCLSPGLHSLFQYALNVGKKVRTESQLSRGAISHSQAATEVILKSCIELNKSLITIIGVHKLNEDIIKFLLSKGAETIFLGNKSFEKAAELAEKHGCSVFRLDQLKEFLKFTDVLISATSAPHTIVNFDLFPKNKEMLILDLAFPRDVDETIGNIKGVKLYNLEDIENVVTQNIGARKNEIAKAEQIIEEEVRKFQLKQQRYVRFITTIQGNLPKQQACPKTSR
jgi:glutamyl-tRNA reductase